ncbi:hypothetical protein Micbo1qcDRAFT_157837 [Microdochium bolleyi]|uniref:Secreted protein n=1 Tax=Microdochium bolleyi TaxID=196109 RepID=A0A136JF36_9PEZI|nr:hypothetical protein Micbo1qcDRAFT_157837 [Microdochium bolleyi]
MSWVKHWLSQMFMLRWSAVLPDAGPVTEENPTTRAFPKIGKMTRSHKQSNSQSPQRGIGRDVAAPRRKLQPDARPVFYCCGFFFLSSLRESPYSCVCSWLAGLMPASLPWNEISVSPASLLKTLRGSVAHVRPNPSRRLPLCVKGSVR